jgi:hypothetical protein
MAERSIFFRTVARYKKLFAELGGAMFDAKCLQDALEQLKDQREHLANTTRVLEAIICHCSNIARAASVSRIREVAIRFRDSAITAYARSVADPRAIADLLEETIAGLESELATPQRA